MQPDSNGPAATLGVHVQPSADVDERAELGAGTRVWHLAQIRENARIGRGCVIGRGAYVGPGVILGNHVKLQNYALVYEPARLEDGVFIGPSAVLTNDVYPRSVGVTGQLKRPEDWRAAGVVVREGASVGARAVIIAGVKVGRWALIAAGAVVTRDVPDFGLVAGVPARTLGWVGRAGVRLSPAGDSWWRCPETGDLFTETDGALTMMQDRITRGIRELTRLRAGNALSAGKPGSMSTLHRVHASNIRMTSGETESEGRLRRVRT